MTFVGCLVVGFCCCCCCLFAHNLYILFIFIFFSDATPGVWLRGRIATGCSVYRRAVTEEYNRRRTTSSFSSSPSSSVFMVVTGGDCGGFGVRKPITRLNIFFIFFLFFFELSMF